MEAATGKEGDASDILRVVEKQYRDNLERTIQRMCHRNSVLSLASRVSGAVVVLLGTRSVKWY
jgi:hypothetical protein